jgi:hypothetical protein
MMLMVVVLRETFTATVLQPEKEAAGRSRKRVWLKDEIWLKQA